jgi:hypothetical protein
MKLAFCQGQLAKNITGSIEKKRAPTEADASRVKP